MAEHPRPDHAPPAPAHGPSCGHGHHHAPAAEKAKDPVCGMSVDPRTAKHSAEHDGRTYYFCCGGCRTKFLADPQRYLAPDAARPAPAPVPEGTIYTCPMHPEIRQVGPGSCPICGMALEPAVITAEAGPNPELVDMTRRFWIGLVLTLPVLALDGPDDGPSVAVVVRGTAGEAARTVRSVKQITAYRRFNIYLVIDSAPPADALNRIAAGRTEDYLLFLEAGVQPTDPRVYAAVSLVLIAVALLASYLPARRASRIAPLIALRDE